MYNKQPLAEALWYVPANVGASALGSAKPQESKRCCRGATRSPMAQWNEAFMFSY